jgi:hypothetical protein
MAALVQRALEIAHVGILLRIDPRIREQHRKAVDVEFHDDGPRPAQSLLWRTSVEETKKQRPIELGRCLQTKFNVSEVR